MAGTPCRDGLQRQARRLPTGFRFRPIDEELVLYLRRRVLHGEQAGQELFHEVNLNHYHPSKLIELFDRCGEKKVHLFSPRCRKYPNGERPSRSAVGGYWKASGKDSKIVNEKGQVIGTKRALSFFEGHQSKGTKTNWLMREYKINESHRPPNSGNGCTTLDDWVLCVVYLKSNGHGGEQKGRKSNSTSSFEEGGSTVLATSFQINEGENLHMDDTVTDDMGRGKNIIVDGEPSTSSQTNMAPLLHMDPTWMDNTDHGEEVIVGDQVNTSCDMYDQINMGLEDLAHANCHGLPPSTLSCGKAIDHCDHLYASSTMDPQGVSVLGPVKIMEPSSFNMPACNSLTQSLHAYDHEGYYNAMSFGSCDHPIIPTVGAAIVPQGIMNKDQAISYIGYNPPYAQSLQHNIIHQAGCTTSTQTEAQMINYEPSSSAAAQPSEHHNHQFFLRMQLDNGDTTMGLMDQTPDRGFCGWWNGASTIMNALTSFEHASSASQPPQYENHQDRLHEQLHINGATIMQSSDQPQEQGGFGGWSSTGASMNMGASTSYEPIFSAPQCLHCDDRQSYLKTQTDNGIYETDFGVPYGSHNNHLNVCNNLDAISPNIEQYWNKQSQELSCIIDPAFCVEDFLELGASDVIGDLPTTSQAPADSVELPTTHVVPETSTADAPLSAMICGMATAPARFPTRTMLDSAAIQRRR